MNTRKLRLEYIRIKHGIVKNVTDLGRARDLSKSRSLDTRYPGHIVGMDVFYVGTLKGVGRIYQFTAIDTYSYYAWAKLYTDKKALSACDFMMHVQNNSQSIQVDSVLTDNGKEFTHHASKNHSFERMLGELKIKHRLTKVRHTWTEPVNMGDKINSAGWDNKPYVTIDGISFFYTSTKSGTRNIYWVDAKIIEELKPDHMK